MTRKMPAKHRKALRDVRVTCIEPGLRCVEVQRATPTAMSTQVISDRSCR